MLYHYVITVQAPAPGGFSIGTYSDTIEWYGTRSDAFNDRFSQACRLLRSDPSNTYVVHWSFELNDLSRK